MSDESAVRGTPTHLWIVGVLAVLWNAYGCVDYLMKLPTIAQMPLWVHIAWAAGVWGGLLGSALLLLRNRWATHAFRLSLLGAAIGTAYQVRTVPASQPMQPAEWALTVAILLVCVALLIYARWQTARGVLR